MGPLLAHLVGDYLFQSDWMAMHKRRSLWVALWHGAAYTVPFPALMRSPAALLWIFLTHALIDHLGVARYVVWARNFLAPRYHRPPPFVVCADTGNDPAKPNYLAVWLTIIADNALHLLCNTLALS